MGKSKARILRKGINDQLPKISRQDAIKKVEEVCINFEVMREQLLQIYSKTRFMEQPEGYVPDSNAHNHLSAKTMNSDWVFYYELPMVKAMREWLQEVRE